MVLTQPILCWFWLGDDKAETFIIIGSGKVHQWMDVRHDEEVAKTKVSPTKLDVSYVSDIHMKRGFLEDFFADYLYFDTGLYFGTVY